MPKPDPTADQTPRLPSPSERLMLLRGDRFRKLEHWRESLSTHGRRLPHFDPLDGGADARLLLLLETPGPGDAPIRFVSRDNETGTARNLKGFLDAAGIERRNIVLWNTVPWIVHAFGARNRALRKAEISEGLGSLPGLIERLPRLQVVILAGRVAKCAARRLAEDHPAFQILEMPHPSPSNVCTSPRVGEEIRETMMTAAERLLEPRKDPSAGSVRPNCNYGRWRSD
jgi:uracil-DNA glycosylase